MNKRLIAVCETINKREVWKKRQKGPHRQALTQRHTQTSTDTQKEIQRYREKQRSTHRSVFRVCLVVHSEVFFRHSSEHAENKPLQAELN